MCKIQKKNRKQLEQNLEKYQLYNTSSINEKNKEIDINYGK